jgi:hypothetical protein
LAPLLGLSFLLLEAPHGLSVLRHLSLVTPDFFLG